MTSSYVLTTEDDDRWRELLPAAASVFGSVEYARICERQTGGQARLFVVETAGQTIVYSYLQRAVADLPFASAAGRSGLWDTFTPEYCGPLCFGPEASNEEVRGVFKVLFERHCAEEGIVAEFAHLNPWIDFSGLLEPSCVELNREIVYVDLAQSEDDIFLKSFSRDGRRQTKQALRAGLRVRRAETAEDVIRFYELHRHTMERVAAHEKYHLPAEYFLQFFETMPENSFYALTEHEGRIIAGGLYLLDDSTVYWHLSAADREALPLRPVNAYVFDTLRSFALGRRQRMLLGGSYRPDDGVFRFKANFSPLRARFSTYKRIHNPAEYEALTKASRAHGACETATGFFPAYRDPKVHE